MSLWAIEYRFAIISKFKGTEAQKVYYDTIKLATRQGFLRSFAYHISRRNENSFSFSVFSKEILQKIDNWDIEEDFRRYLKYKFVRLYPDSIAESASIIFHESRGNIIDTYTTVVDLLFNYHSKGAEIHALIVQSFGIISDIPDPIFEALRTSLANQSSSEINWIAAYTNILEYKFEVGSGVSEFSEFMADTYENSSGSMNVKCDSVLIELFYSVRNTIHLQGSYREAVDSIGGISCNWRHYTKSVSCIFVVFG